MKTSLNNDFHFARFSYLIYQVTEKNWNVKAAANDEHLFEENNGFQQMLTKQLFAICGALNIIIKIHIIEQLLRSNKCWKMVWPPPQLTQHLFNFKSTFVRGQGKFEQIFVKLLLEKSANRSTCVGK